jgi:hypothetical protein
MAELNPAWRKSTYSGNGVDCVQTGSVPGLVLIRDTKDRGNGPVLKVSPAQWQRFTKSIKG